MTPLTPRNNCRSTEEGKENNEASPSRPVNFGVVYCMRTMFFVASLGIRMKYHLKKRDFI